MKSQKMKKLQLLFSLNIYFMKYNIDQRIMTDDDIIDYFEFLVSYGKDIELEVKKSYNNLIFLGS